MEEPENKESPTHDEKVGDDETTKEFLDCEGQVQTEGTFSEEAGDCNGMDVMVEVLGSDVYIDGVCTSGSGAELNEEFGCGGKFDGDEDLDKDMKPAGVGSGKEARFDGSQAVGSEVAGNDIARVESDGVALEREESVPAVVSSGEFDVASMNKEALSDNRVQEEVGTGVSFGNTASGEVEVPTVEVVGVEGVNAGVLNQVVANARSDYVSEPSATVTSVEGENLESGLTGNDNQKGRHLAENGASEDGNDEKTLKTLEEQKNIANLKSDKVLEDEGNNCDKVEFDGTLNSVGEQPMEVDKVVDNSSRIPEEAVGRAKGAVYKASSKSEEKRCFMLEKCVEKDHGTDASQVNSDTGEKMELEKEMGGVSDAEQCTLPDGMEMEVDDQPETKKIKGKSETDEVQDGISEIHGSNGGQEIEESKEARQRRKDGKVTKRTAMKPAGSEIIRQAGYLLPAEKEGDFSVSDMVWGKVKSHPWWPGQIFDPSEASEKAMKHYKKDCYLVAYFGDRTFAWNEASQLKLFRKHFSAIENHSTSESFQNAVDSALDEVTRRVEFGLACPCIPKGTYKTIRHQIVENAGIRQKRSSKHNKVDESLNASTFSPDKLIEYLKTLSVVPTGRFDRLELVIAKAQLLAYYRYKGYSSLPEIQYGEELDSDMDNLIHDGEKSLSGDNERVTPASKSNGKAGPKNLKSKSSSRQKRKHNLTDSKHPTKKERSMSELMGPTPDSPDGDNLSDEKVTDNQVLSGRSKKKRTVDPFADDSGMQDGRKAISLAKVSNTKKPSFKIGECLRRVASQLTGSPSMLKSSGDRSQKTDGSTDGNSGNGCADLFRDFEEAQKSSATVPAEYSSLEDLLSSLQRVAQDPVGVGDYHCPSAIMSFFSDFRNSTIVAGDSAREIFSTGRVGTKRKKPPIAGTPEAFEFEDMSDTYWTDRVVDNGAEEKPPVEKPPRKNRKKDNQSVAAEPGKPVKVSRRPYSRKRHANSNLAEVSEKPSGYIDENAPAELIMNFAELDSVPSEGNLNRMFRRFGPLKESETEVDRVSSRARVVFKKCADAEVACSSAKKYNIFGPVLVNYELNYSPSALFKASSVSTTQDQEMHLDLSNFEDNMV